MLVKDWGSLVKSWPVVQDGMPVCSNDKPEHTDWYEHVGLPQSEITIAELLPQTTTGVVVLQSVVRNQGGETVLEGEHRYVVKKRAEG